MGKLNGYELLRLIKNGHTYKFYRLLELLTSENKCDSDGFISLSNKQIQIKLGISHNTNRVIKDLKAYGLIEVIHGDSGTSNKYRII